MNLLSCIIYFSTLNGIDPQLTKAIISVESNWKIEAVNQNEDFGLMQVRKRYVKETKKQLLDPCTNIRVGTEILKQAKERCKHRVDLEFVTCYNLGIAGGSRIKYPRKFPYYTKVLKAFNDHRDISHFQKHVPILFREVPFTLPTTAKK